MKTRRIISVILAAFLIFITVLPVFASTGGVSSGNSAGSSLIDIIPSVSKLGVSVNNTVFSDLKDVTVKFSTVYETAATWEFPYTDEFFSQNENQYSHIFARASLGLSMAAFRSKLVNNDGYSDLESYFTQIGFGDISAESFNHTPTANSVTYAIASKALSDQTVIAVVCCGAGYGAEWSSNLTIGDGTRHQGFDESAAVVESALYEYIEEHNISGKISLWTSGFSRAAAIANLVAADMTDLRQFQGVYCYTFATPRTTRDSSRTFSNIFNIIGKNDPVPSIPFADWGYTRYGTDLYTPTIQMDSDFLAKKDRMSDILESIDGHRYIYNPEFCSQLRVFFDYLYTLIPDSADYTSDLQPGVLHVMANSSSGNILSLVSSIISTFSPENEAESEELNSLMDYIQQLANQYVLRGNADQIKAGMWDPSLNVTQNLTSEHDPDKYLAWMMLSDDPEEIFGQNNMYRQFSVSGNAEIELFDMYGYVETFDTSGNRWFDDSYNRILREDHYTPQLYIEKASGQINISVPSDEYYLLNIKAGSEQTLTYYAITHSSDSVRSGISNIYSADISPENDYYIFADPSIYEWKDTINTGAAVTDVFSGTQLYSPSMILKLQNINILHLTLSQIILFGGLLIIFSYTELIVCVTLGLVRTFRGYQRNTIPTITMHSLNAAIFLALEVALWYFVPAYPVLKLAAKLISFIFILSLAVVALTEYFSKRNIFLTIGVLAGMIFSLIFEDTLIPAVTDISVLIKCVFYAMLTVAAALTWIGHTRRRAFKIAEIEQKRHNKKMAKAEKAMQKAYDKSERATQKYLARQKKKEQKKELH